MDLPAWTSLAPPWLHLPWTLTGMTLQAGPPSGLPWLDLPGWTLLDGPRLDPPWLDPPGWTSLSPWLDHPGCTSLDPPGWTLLAELLWLDPLGWTPRLKIIIVSTCNTNNTITTITVSN